MGKRAHGIRNLLTQWNKERIKKEPNKTKLAQIQRQIEEHLIKAKRDKLARKKTLTTAPSSVTYD